MISEQAILRKLEKQPKQAAGFKQLVRELGARGSERQVLAEMLAEMVGTGKLKADADRSTNRSDALRTIYTVLRKRQSTMAQQR